MAPEPDETIENRVQNLFAAHQNKIAVQADWLFAGLMIFQWLAGIVIALLVSPRTWSGAESWVHPHVWAAVALGGALCSLPVALVWNRPGARLNRHVIAMAQMLTSSLLIQITGGRIETHFHVFGSLAFLAFYRDWEVMLTATAVTGVDHALRGIFWPFSIYGRTWVSPWLSVEHAGWVVFSDIFLVWSCLRSRAEMSAIATREAGNAHLLHQAQHDALTGLPNRLLFAVAIKEGLQRAAKSGGNLALLCIDLDRFKQINDTLGHQVGDQLLQSVGRRLSHQLCGKGTLVRMGGDEFAVILEGISSPEAANSTAAKLLDSLQEPFELAGNEMYLGASIGICLYPDCARDSTELQRNADIAMYRVKSQGKNGYETFAPEMAPSTLKRMDTEHQLRQAIVRNEFLVLYQPQVTLDGKLKGFEALVRWEHPKLGLIPPNEFIPVAEETGLIRPVGDFVMRKACRQGAIWQQRWGRNLRIAVNVSAVQFSDPSFAETVAEVLEETGLPPQLLELELTETVLMRDLVSAAERMESLRALGLRIAMDDFGTGYSSLSYIHKLPIDVLKIDRSFIKEIHSESHSRAMFASILTMARDLKLDVVAEGVEEPGQVEVLAELGCPLAQGFLFGRPAAAVEAERFIANSQRVANAVFEEPQLAFLR